MAPAQEPYGLQDLGEEIRGSFQSADEVSVTKLVNLKYLTAVIEEGHGFTRRCLQTCLG